MTHRERIVKVLRREIPDCVPVCPDISNMIPVRLTGKQGIDVYLFEDPPLWKAYIDAVKYFDLDGGFECVGIDVFGDWDNDIIEERIVQRWDDGRVATRPFNHETGEWNEYLRVFIPGEPPAFRVRPETVGLPETPETWEPVEPRAHWPKGQDLWRLVREEMGDHGVLGLPSGASTLILRTPEDIVAYLEDPGPFFAKRDAMIESCTKRMEQIAALVDPPDFVMCGGSGSLVFQSPDIVRELTLPVLQHVTRLGREMGIPTHVHSCGPERALIKMAAEETDLTIIDPLEQPLMGDTNLAEVKRLYGERLVLKGNLLTTQTMLKGSVDDVRTASKRAIDDGAAGGGFILSTGDQCGRDTPLENIRAMVEVARTYGRY